MATNVKKHQRIRAGMRTGASRAALVVADVHERTSGVPALLEQLDVRVEVAALPAGDYAIGAKVVVERKSMPDLHETVVRGRFWRQIDKLRRACRYPFLLVEGPHIDDGPIPPKAIRGICVAAITHGIRLVRTEDRHDSAMWLHALALREANSATTDRPVYSQRPRPTSTREAAEAVLAAVPGISTVSARALLAHFGSVSAVAAADPIAWTQVRGIGADRARALEETLNFRPGTKISPPDDPGVSRNRVSS
jgi:DNA excision repair protein ERCC-4